jgi:hypothetical protein
MSTSPQSVAEHAANEFRAREILAARPPVFFMALVSVATTGLAVYGAAISSLPTPTLIWLLVTSTLAPPLAIEVWFLRRRLEASLVLLKLSSGGL